MNKKAAAAMEANGSEAMLGRQLQEAQAQARELAASPALILTVAVNRISGAITFANNIDQARIDQDIDQAINALEVITREMRREQLRLAAAGGNGSNGSNGRQADNGHKPDMGASPK